MGRAIGQRVKESVTVNQVPIGGIAPVFRSGDAYKAVGEVVKRSDYPLLSAAFPRNGSLSSFTTNIIADGATLIWSPPVFGNGIFMSVAKSSNSASATNVGAISVDGKNWQRIALPVATAWQSVAFGNGYFIAVGGDTANPSNAFARTTDGINWTKVNYGGGEGCSCCAFGNGVFVAASGTNTQVYSTDNGLSWQNATGTGVVGAGHIVFGNGVFLMLGNGRTESATSVNGSVWTARTLPEPNGGKAATYAAGLFVVGAQSITLQRPVVLTSPDAISWTVRQIPYDGGVPTGCAYGNGVFVLLNGSSVGGCWISYDAINWRYQILSAKNNQRQVGYGAGIFVTIGGSNTEAGYFYAENMTDSTDMYIQGLPGQFVRVK